MKGNIFTDEVKRITIHNKISHYSNVKPCLLLVCTFHFELIKCKSISSISSYKRTFLVGRIGNKVNSILLDISP